MGKLAGKRVLVTGGNGYLGSHLVAALKRAGANVFVMSRKGSKGKNGFKVDITNQAKVHLAVQDIKPQLIYHLAATLNRNRDFKEHDDIMQVNYFGTVNLLRALQGSVYENFIFASTSEVYGSNAAPFNETQLPDPPSPYSLSKFFAETAIRTFSELQDRNYTVLRLFNFFGRNMPVEFFIPQLLHSLKYGNIFKMTKGEQARDFLYVEDVVQALLLAGIKANARNEIFNVCSSRSVTLRKLVMEFQKRLKSNCKINFGALPYRKSEVWNMTGSNKKINAALGFRPQYNLKAAINQLIQ
jgi:nucleoside-diphosphate-sugar epimerase